MLEEYNELSVEDIYLSIANEKSKRHLYRRFLKFGN